jgi:hypothetical protein
MLKREGSEDSRDEDESDEFEKTKIQILVVKLQAYIRKLDWL